ncbi:MAG: homoserine kinase [Candidatus Cloacimonetes bacterium]|mgnify:CR=1 FL=1|jgi:homoserine kinase type II|nr:homoserine kinase [Candidatus Cloacimonadota bacterium]
MKLENIKKVLENYKLGSLKDCKKISHGFANLNFKITTANGNFLFRINKHQELSTIQYELRVLNELKKINFPTAYPISRRDDRFITVTAEDKIVIYDFIEGEIPDINIRTVSEMATAAARLNSIPNWQKFTKKNAINIDNCFDLMGKFDTAKCKYPEVFKHFSEQTEYLDKYVRENLPQGIIHSDLFPDNTIFKDNKLIAFIDFEEVCTDDLIFEVGMAINGFCFINNELDADLLKIFVQSYHLVRPLSQMEMELLPFYIQWTAHGMVSWHLQHLLEREYDRQLDRTNELISRVKKIRKINKWELI